MTKVSEQEYQQAVATISKIKHTNLDYLVDQTAPVGSIGLFFGSLFSMNRIQGELQGIEGLLSLLVTQEHLPAKRLRPDRYGRWHLSEHDDRALRTLYRQQTLQKMLDDLRQAQQTVQLYAHQETIREKNQYQQMQVVKNPLMIRPQDQVKNFKKRMLKQTKKYERIAAKQSMQRQHDAYQDMIRKASRYPRRNQD